MIWDLANTGGIAGLNLYGPFLGTKKESKIEEMTAHILHMLNEGGSEFPAIGTDFDGFDGMTRMEIAHPDELEKLWEALKQKGVSEAQLDKHPRLRPSFDTLIIACQSRLAYALV